MALFADGGSPSPIEQQNKRLKTYGYGGSHFTMNANRFVLPQSRPRVYMFYFKTHAGDPSKIEHAVKKFQATQ